MTVAVSAIADVITAPVAPGVPVARRKTHEVLVDALAAGIELASAHRDDDNEDEAPRKLTRARTATCAAEGAGARAPSRPSSTARRPPSASTFASTPPGASTPKGAWKSSRKTRRALASSRSLPTVSGPRSARFANRDAPRRRSPRRTGRSRASACTVCSRCGITRRSARGRLTPPGAGFGFRRRRRLRRLTVAAAVSTGRRDRRRGRRRRGGRRGQGVRAVRRRPGGLEVARAVPGLEVHAAGVQGALRSCPALRRRVRLEKRIAARRVGRLRCNSLERSDAGYARRAASGAATRAGVRRCPDRRRVRARTIAWRTRPSASGSTKRLGISRNVSASRSRV